MGLIRPQLLFFGESPSGIRSFDRAELSRDETIRWIESILIDFDVILILEHLELSLALISIQLGWFSNWYYILASLLTFESKADGWLADGERGGNQFENQR